MRVVKMQDVKSNEEVVLPGVEVILIKENGTTKEIGLVTEGHTYVIHGDYGLKIRRPADPVFVKRYRATVTILGKELELGVYEDEYEARRETSEAKDVEITEVQVPEESL
jgi:hypothetical protein